MPDQALILTVVFDEVPRPRAIGIEELGPYHRIGLSAGGADLRQ